MLSNEEWDVLIDSIKRKECTPFLGAGIASGVLPNGSELAQKLAQRFGYPFPDSSNLTRVSQYVALVRDRMTPKLFVLDDFKKASVPDYTNASEPHGTLADLRLPIYLTTNYDPFMYNALRDRGWDPEREFYRWNRYLKEFLSETPSIFDTDKSYRPTAARPLVFHMHGNEQVPQSMVLIEDDYIDFLLNTSQPEYSLPLPVSRSLLDTSLLFIGYGMNDWNFRVLLGSIHRDRPLGIERLNVAVIPKPKATKGAESATEAYLTKHFQTLNVRVHWASAQQFCVELRQRLASM
jgi:hypothetical protein